MKNNLTFSYFLTKEDKRNKYKHNSLVVWFFGLSASGKSTLCDSVEQSLFDNNIKTVVLDGDSLRNGLNKDLGFSEKQREENLRRVSEISKIQINNGLVTLCAFITPLEKNRSLINSIIGRDMVFWIYVDTPLEICSKRDPKGLYKMAESGEISNFTGVSSPFEMPNDFDYKTDYNESIKTISKKITSKILNKIKI